MLARHFMLRDASHRQVIQKFSFIRELDFSQRKEQAGKLESNQDIHLSPAVPAGMSTSVSQADLDLASLNLANSRPAQDESSAMVAAAPTTNTIDTNWYQSASNGYGLNLAATTDYSVTNNLANDQSSRGNYLGKILFALATGYCLFALWWLFGHQGSRLLTSWAGGKHITLSKSEVEFIDYAERSLETIERKLETKKADSDKDESTVYVPVYTPSTAPSFPQVANLPLTSPSYNSAPNNAPQIPDSMAIAQPAPPSKPLKIPSPPPLPTSTPLESNSGSNTSAASPPEKVAAKPAIKYTLIGILELGGNKSAALVKINGQTRRIWAGETINNEGWILDSVSSQAVNITQNGQSRSVAVGETF